MWRLSSWVWNHFLCLTGRAIISDQLHNDNFHVALRGDAWCFHTNPSLQWRGKFPCMEWKFGTRPTQALAHCWNPNCVWVWGENYLALHFRIFGWAMTPTSPVNQTVGLLPWFVKLRCQLDYLGRSMKTSRRNDTWMIPGRTTFFLNNGYPSWLPNNQSIRRLNPRANFIFLTSTAAGTVSDSSLKWKPNATARVLLFIWMPCISKEI